MNKLAASVLALSDRLLGLPRYAKRGIALVIDVFLIGLTVWLAFQLRLGLQSPVPLDAVFWTTAILACAFALPIFVRSGLYRAIFRYSGLSAMLVLTRALLIYGLLFAGVFTVWGVDGVPPAVGILQPMLLVLMMGGLRTVVRFWLGEYQRLRGQRKDIPLVLIYGAGSAGRQLASAIGHSRQMRVVGYLDDDAGLQGNQLNGYTVFNPAKLQAVLGETKATQVLLALPTVSRTRRNAILETLKPFSVAVRTLPELSDIASGKVALSDLRELDIDDLLGREPVRPNGLLLHLNTSQKTVLVTGAGGSIGSELCRQILNTRPQRLLLLDMSEFALYQIHQELVGLTSGVSTPAPDQDTGDIAPVETAQKTAQVPGLEIVPLLASVCDEVRMHEIMNTWQPHTVYHAAAYKHVPLVEHNPAEGLRNNVWGTKVCAEAAARNGVRNFVLISTDKAVRPTNIMGATKRLAEMVLQGLSELNPAVLAQGGDPPRARTTFSMVRFGNVLGSSGSVVPLFRQQIRQGGPLTITHPEITRFFMTIPEAAQLVIQAGAMATGGDVFVLDMGQSVRIIELARRMVELSGLTIKDENHPEGDIELQLTGLRPGEKLYEELLIGHNPKPTQHSRIMKAHEAFMPWPQLEEQLNALSIAMSVNDVPVIRGLLQSVVDDYEPSGNVVDWVHLELEKQVLAADQR